MMSHSAAVRSARQSALAGAIALAAAGVAPSAVSAQIPTTRASATTPAATRPAGPAAYRAIADEAEANLTDQVIDRWFPRAVDEANGGFLESFGPDWSPGENDSKAIVFQSRLTWVAAKMAGRDPDRAEQFKAWARHGVAFLSDEMWDGANGGPYWSVDNAGDPTTDRGTEKHAYGIAFGIYAASAAYEATGDPAALDFAKKSFAWLDAHAHDDDDGGYFEPLTADGTPILSPPDGADGPQQDVLGTRYGLKTMNSHIHLLEALTGLYEVWPDPAVRGRLEEVFGLVRDRILVGSIGFQNLYFTPDWGVVPGDESFGHDVETAYLLAEASAALGRPDDPAVWALARRIVDHNLQYGFDPVHGGFYDAGHVFGPPTDTDKVWWVQAEGLNALLLMHERFGGGTDAYWNAFNAQWRFIEDHVVDREHGGWRPDVARDGTPPAPPQDKSNSWTEAYHQGRALMNVTDRLRAMAGD